MVNQFLCQAMFFLPLLNFFFTKPHIFFYQSTMSLPCIFLYICVGTFNLIDVVTDMCAISISGTKGSGNGQTPHKNSTDSGNHEPALRCIYVHSAHNDTCTYNWSLFQLASGLPHWNSIMPWYLLRPIDDELAKSRTSTETLEITTQQRLI